MHGDACNILDEMPEKDTVVWNLMIVGFARAGLLAEAMDFPSLFSVCGKSGELRMGKEVHGRVIHCLSFSYDVVVNNSLIEIYAKCGCLDVSYVQGLLAHG